MKRPLLAMLLFASLVACGRPASAVSTETSTQGPTQAPTTAPLPTTTLVPSSPQPVQRCRCPAVFPSQPESGSVDSCYSGTFTEGRCGYIGFGGEMAPDGDLCRVMIDGREYYLHFDSCPGCPVGVGTTMYSGPLQPGLLVDVDGQAMTVEGFYVFMPERVTLCPIQ